MEFACLLIHGAFLDPLCITIHHEGLNGFSIHVNLTHLQAYLLSLVIGMVYDFRTCRLELAIAGREYGNVVESIGF